MSDTRRTFPLAVQDNCPMSPPKHASVPARCLHRACLIVGGIDQLASRLKVSKAQLEAWIRDEGEPPQATLYAALDIVLLYVGAGPIAM